MKTVFVLSALISLATAGAEEANRTECSFRLRWSTVTVRLVADAQPSGERIHIAFSNARLPEQVIPCADTNELMAAENEPGFESVDYDRDGYKDFSLLDPNGTAANKIRHFFFYNPTKRRFELRRDFEESGVSSFDPRTGLFSMYWRGSASSAGSASYRLERGRLRLVSTIKQGYASEFRDILPNADEFAEYLVTTVYSSNGKMRRFYRYIGQ